VSYLDRIRECNSFDRAAYRPFVVDGRQYGWVGHGFAARLAGFTDVFVVADDAVTLAPALTGFEPRSAAVEAVLRRLADDGVIRGWRDEPYPVTTGPNVPPVLQMERAAVPLFGVRAFGIHLNGFVRGPDGIAMWIGRRAGDKPTFPGLLDNMVAGGQPLGLTARETLVKEAEEEAGIPPTLAARAAAVGEIAYCAEIDGGLRPDTMYCFDIELPEDFMPVNRDGEIETFYLWPIERVATTVRDTRAFKFNCNLVIIDFLIRHGFMAQNDPEYPAIAAGLRQYAAANVAAKRG